MQELDSQEWTEQSKQDRYTLSFIHSPFCATCHLAEKMLRTLEELYNEEVFIKVNASLNPFAMERFQIESVPCLLIMKNEQIVKKVYAFQSVPHMYEQTAEYVKQ
ncbi:thioredoxin family protein [Halobacillus sp. ACCC02827]|uniref:thioredoxin family protein n=1 Tax=Halobacillus sp. ACCC02827 TaxID=3052090 RepID=UPI0025701EB3|nr:thioredoxin family protein [Halobacillus sp. ACCC02827]WJE14776.1 thioredoxin family protein [Halobacillus sp. ACCC02827]